MTEFVGTTSPMSQHGLDQALGILSVGQPELWTVLSVETSGFGFLPDRRPLILFERHIFHQQTAGIFDAASPGISSPIPGGYLGGSQEYTRLAAAMALNAHAALNSASWGIGQVMGFNSRLAGFDTVEAMVAAMVQSEDAQLAGMASFVRAKGLHKPLAQHDWAGFARGYNGEDFAKNQYDAKLASFFQKFATGPLPDIRVRQAQALLTFLGMEPNGVDGISGKGTQSAIVRFRQQNGMGNSGEIDDALIAAMSAKMGAASSSAST